MRASAASLRISCWQCAPSHGDPAANLRRLEEELGEASEPGNLVLLPELFLTGYLYDDRQRLLNLAATIPGPETERLAAAAARPRGARWSLGPDRASSGCTIR